MARIYLLAGLSCLACLACSESELKVTGDEGQPGVGQQNTNNNPGQSGSGGNNAAGPGEGPAGAPDDGLCGQIPEPADEVFSRAMCLCGDLGDFGQGLRTRSWSHTWGRDEGRGHVAINGTADIVGYANVNGMLEIGGDLKGLGKVTAEGDLRTGGSFGGVGSYAALGDAYVNGDLGGLGYVRVLGDLYINGQVQTLGVVDYENLGGSFAWSGVPPCGCADHQIIDVAAEVQARRQRNNNSSLPTGGLGLREFTLQSGEYYFDNANLLVGSARIRIEGHVALYLEDDLDTVGNLDIELGPRAELELWVSGSVRTIGNLRFAREGDARARAFKLYVGGEEAAIVNVGLGRFYGGIYAPRADIGFFGGLKIYGSVFARNIHGAGSLDVFYDTDLVVPDDCAESWPDPVDEVDRDCKSDDNCPEGQICDELTRECVDEPDCQNDNDCPGNDRCIDGHCVVL